MYIQSLILFPAFVVFNISINTCALFPPFLIIFSIPDPFTIPSAIISWSVFTALFALVNNFSIGFLIAPRSTILSKIAPVRFPYSSTLSNISDALTPNLCIFPHSVLESALALPPITLVPPVLPNLLPPSRPPKNSFPLFLKSSTLLLSASGSGSIPFPFNLFVKLFTTLFGLNLPPIPALKLFLFPGSVGPRSYIFCISISCIISICITISTCSLVIISIIIINYLFVCWKIYS